MSWWHQQSLNINTGQQSTTHIYSLTENLKSCDQKSERLNSDKTTKNSATQCFIPPELAGWSRWSASYLCSLENTNRCSSPHRRHRWRHSHSRDPDSHPHSPRRRCHGNQMHMRSWRTTQRDNRVISSSYLSAMLTFVQNSHSFWALPMVQISLCCHRKSWNMLIYLSTFLYSLFWKHRQMSHCWTPKTQQKNKQAFFD